MSVFDQARQKARSAVKELLRSDARGLRREIEIETLRSFPPITVPEHIEPGVLLSDRIQWYATTYKMIDPFYPSKLKPAGYELSVGDLFSIQGKTHSLAADRPDDEIVIDPFEVVVIQTLERLNLPTFLIARWNVRTRWAYRGLLWVGAAQVDPGFKGYLACPLYNLSDKPVRLHRGDEIAVIDFVTTTHPTKTSISYDPYKRTRVLFEDYDPNALKSALATQAQERLASVEAGIKELRARVEAAVTVIATAVGILVAALALFVSKEYPESISRFSSATLLAILALVIAIVSIIHSSYRHIVTDKRRITTLFVFEVVVIALLLWISFSLYALRDHHQMPPTQNPVTRSLNPH